MSDWSSFQGDKNRHDKWRSFLTESKEPKKIEEMESYFDTGAGLADAFDQAREDKRRERRALKTDKKLSSADDQNIGAAILDWYRKDIEKNKKVNRQDYIKKTIADFKKSYADPEKSAPRILRDRNITPEEFIEWIRWRSLFPESKREELEALRAERDASPEENPEAATADPDAPQPESGQASVRVGQTVRNLAGHLMTMDQAKLVQALVIRALNKAGYGKAIRMDESKSSKLLRRFLKNPKVLYEIATSGYSHAASQQSQRQARRTSQALPVIDLSSVGIKPENQAQVKNILDRMLSGVGLEVEFGPARSQSQPAAAAEPKAPAAAKPKAPAAAEPKAPAAAKPEVAADPEGKDTAAFRVSASEVQSVLTSPDASMGPGRSFRSKLVKYLRNYDLPKEAHANSTLVKGITNAIRDMLKVGPYTKKPDPRLPQYKGPNPQQQTRSLEESINNIFLPIILEEIKRERIRRLIVEETQRVLNEKR